MSRHSWSLTPELQEYLRQINGEEAPVLAELRAETERHRHAKMPIAPEQAQTLVWFADLIGAGHYLEIGVFTGYSSTAMALALPEHGRITACDISVTYTDIARHYWQAAGVAHKIELVLQPALITLDQLLAQGAHNHYDLALIDADKPPTAHYFERCLQLVRPGGLIAIDNVLLGGRVTRAVQAQDAPSVALMQAFNAALVADTRVRALTLPVGDGLTIVQKRRTEAV